MHCYCVHILLMTRATLVAEDATVPGSESLALWMDSWNEGPEMESVLRERMARHDLISLSHFLPRQVCTYSLTCSHICFVRIVCITEVCSPNNNHRSSFPRRGFFSFPNCPQYRGQPRWASESNPCHRMCTSLDIPTLLGTPR